MAKRRKISSEFKFKVALSALKENKTLSELASEYGVAPAQISNWKQQLIKFGPSIFDRGKKSEKGTNQQALIDSLYQKIGELHTNLDWLQKKGLDR